jgi:hypothetical protein
MTIGKERWRRDSDLLTPYEVSGFQDLSLRNAVYHELCGTALQQRIKEIDIVAWSGTEFDELMDYRLRLRLLREFALV